MFALLKKQVLVNVDLKEPSELTAIAKVASFAGEKLDLASQSLRSGFLASEASGSKVISGHIALTHASSAAVKKVEIVIVNFDAAIAWGENAQVDTVVGVIIPESADPDPAMQAVAGKLESLTADFTQPIAAGASEKLRRQL
ncbi:PTS sugar transporter subunit IIA [Lacticaseibacillus porcinae]|uniref:PTS sugar transporter subunit IIA n=1 Tax=Lacticaseibacillus porcinae TaxID=1123687 RepID=UPI0013DDB971|nr:PTS sugar transporter subunit IIA [Lacticaseibacillus porcinae]